MKTLSVGTSSQDQLILYVLYKKATIGVVNTELLPRMDTEARYSSKVHHPMFWTGFSGWAPSQGEGAAKINHDQLYGEISFDHTEGETSIDMPKPIAEQNETSPYSELMQPC